MKAFLIKINMSILLCFIISACSSTKVHLYTRYLTDTEIEKISKKLKEAKFNVVPNKLSFPDTVHDSTLLYSPFIQNEERIKSIMHSLAELGWIIHNVHPLVLGNHWYQKDSVGLFLFPEGLKQKDKIASQDLANTYQSRDCSTSVKIILKTDNTYQLVFSNKTTKADHLTGTWKMRSYPYVELVSYNKMWWFYFKIEQKTEKDNIGTIEIVELQPEDKYKFFPNCRFAYGIR